MAYAVNNNRIALNSLNGYGDFNTLMVQSSSMNLRDDQTLTPLEKIDHISKNAVVQQDATAETLNQFVAAEYQYLFDVRRSTNLLAGTVITIRGYQIGNIELQPGAFGTDQSIQPILDHTEEFMIHNYSMKLTVPINVDHKNIEAKQMEMILRLLPSMAVTVLKLMFRQFLTYVVSNQYRLCGTLQQAYTPGQFGLYGTDPRVKLVVSQLLSNYNRVRNSIIAQCALTRWCNTIYIPMQTGMLANGVNFKKDPSPTPDLQKFYVGGERADDNTVFRGICPRIMMHLVKEPIRRIGMFMQYLSSTTDIMHDINNGDKYTSRNIVMDIMKFMRRGDFIRVQEVRKRVYKAFYNIITGNRDREDPGALRGHTLRTMIDSCVDFKLTLLMKSLFCDSTGALSDAVNRRIFNDGGDDLNDETVIQVFDRLFCNLSMMDNMIVARLRELISLPIFGITEKVTTVVQSFGAYADKNIPINNTQASVATSIGMGMNLNERVVITLPDAFLCPVRGVRGIDNREGTIRRDSDLSKKTPYIAIIFDLSDDTTIEETDKKFIDFGEIVENDDAAKEYAKETLIDGRALVSVNKLLDINDSELGYYHGSSIIVIKIGIPNMHEKQVFNMSVRTPIDSSEVAKYIKRHIPVGDMIPPVLDVILPASTADKSCPVMCPISGIADILQISDRK